MSDAKRGGTGLSVLGARTQGSRGDDLQGPPVHAGGFFCNSRRMSERADDELKLLLAGAFDLAWKRYFLAEPELVQFPKNVARPALRSIAATSLALVRRYGARIQTSRFSLPVNSCAASRCRRFGFKRSEAVDMLRITSFATASLPPD